MTRNSADGTDDDGRTGAAPLTEVIHAHGHDHVSAEHQSTFEVTTDDWLTPAGDCILAIEADRAPESFDAAFVEACQETEATITAQLTVAASADDRAAHVESVTGSGHPELTFESDRSLVCRTSSHVDDRTVMTEADVAAVEVDRELVDALATGADLELRLSVA